MVAADRSERHDPIHLFQKLLLPRSESRPLLPCYLHQHSLEEFFKGSLSMLNIAEHQYPLTLLPSEYYLRFQVEDARQRRSANFVESTKKSATP